MNALVILLTALAAPIEIVGPQGPMTCDRIRRTVDPGPVVYECRVDDGVFSDGFEVAPFGGVVLTAM